MKYERVFLFLQKRSSLINVKIHGKPKTIFYGKFSLWKALFLWHRVRQSLLVQNSIQSFMALLWLSEKCCCSLDQWFSTGVSWSSEQRKCQHKNEYPFSVFSPCFCFELFLFWMNHYFLQSESRIWTNSSRWLFLSHFWPL